MNTIPRRIAAAIALAFALSLAARAEEAPKADPPKDPAAREDPKPAGEVPKPEAPKEPERKDDPRALELFDKAIAWQGKPNQMSSELKDLEIDQMDFKIWGEHEVEGHFKILHTPPKKIYFQVWTQAWNRRYWSDGEVYRKKTGATRGDSELLVPGNKDDQEGIDLILEAIRVVRLIFLANHKTPDAIFRDLGPSKPKGRADAPLCHVVMRVPKPGDAAGPTYFYLSPEDFHPVCLGVYSLLTFEGYFFIHLSKFQAFQGVKFPTRIEIYQLKRDEPEKFLFADVIQDPDQGLKVEVNGGIDDEVYK